MKKKKQKQASGTAVLALINRIEAVAKTLEDLCHCIYGNGTPGIKTDVTTLKAQIQVLVWVVGFCILGVVVPLATKILGG